LSTNQLDLAERDETVISAAIYGEAGSAIGGQRAFYNCSKVEPLLGWRH
jgi:hypothetical protein